MDSTEAWPCLLSDSGTLDAVASRGCDYSVGDVGNCGTSPLTTTVQVNDVDSMEFVLPGVQLGFTRADATPGTTTFHSVMHPGVSVHEINIGFSMYGSGQIDDSSLVVVMPVKAGTESTKWEGESAFVGMIQVYGPGASHTALDTAGWGLLVQCVEMEAVAEVAEVLGVDIGDWERRRSRLAVSKRLTQWAISGFNELDSGADGSALARSIVEAIATPSAREGSYRRVSSAAIVGRVEEYLDSTGAWFPAITELCAVARVSERRLRSAFIDQYDLPPARALRVRALRGVHRHLANAAPDSTTVTEVATAHGFRHLGDFARYFRVVFGSPPSETLQSTPASGLSLP